MSYDLILVITLIVVTVGMSILTMIAFRHGYELGVKDYNRKNPEEPKTLPAKRVKKVESWQDRQAAHYATLLENIENYDGTDAHQKEIS